jgi:hypothetical protein
VLLRSRKVSLDENSANLANLEYRIACADEGTTGSPVGQFRGHDVVRSFGRPVELDARKRYADPLFETSRNQNNWSRL